jgi:hypothetical protein
VLNTPATLKDLSEWNYIILITDDAEEVQSFFDGLGAYESSGFPNNYQGEWFNGYVKPLHMDKWTREEFEEFLLSN